MEVLKVYYMKEMSLKMNKKELSLFWVVDLRYNILYCPAGVLDVLVEVVQFSGVLVE